MKNQQPVPSPEKKPTSKHYLTGKEEVNRNFDCVKPSVRTAVQNRQKKHCKQGWSLQAV